MLIYSHDRGGHYVIFDTRTDTDRPFPVSADLRSVLWGSDNETLLYSTYVDGTSRFWRTNLSGSEEHLLLEIEGESQFEGVSSDGRVIAYRVFNEDGSQRLFVRDLEMDDVFEVGDDGEVIFWSLSFSPDNAYFAYTRVGARGSEVFVQPMPPTGQTWRLSNDGGEEPEWLPEGGAIVYRGASRWWLVGVDRSGGEISFTDPEPYFSGPYVNVRRMEYRMLSGGRAVLQRPVNTAQTTSRIEIITSFYRLLDERVP